VDASPGLPLKGKGEGYWEGEKRGSVIRQKSVSIVNIGRLGETGGEGKRT